MKLKKKIKLDNSIIRHLTVKYKKLEIQKMSFLVKKNKYEKKK